MVKKPKSTPELQQSLRVTEDALATESCPENLRPLFEEFADMLRQEITERLEGVIRLQ